MVNVDVMNPGDAPGDGPHHLVLDAVAIRDAHTTVELDGQVHDETGAETVGVNPFHPSDLLHRLRRFPGLPI